MAEPEDAPARKQITRRLRSMTGNKALESRSAETQYLYTGEALRQGPAVQDLHNRLGVADA